MEYWLGVAKCAQADLLLVPQITHWRERVGSTSGVTTPASIAMDMYLIDVKNERLTRVRYEETQVSLSENPVHRQEVRFPRRPMGDCDATCL